MWRPLVSMRPLLAEFGTKEDDRVTTVTVTVTAGTTPVIRIDINMLHISLTLSLNFSI